jgi:rod shape-determining protein MreC
MSNNDNSFGYFKILAFFLFDKFANFLAMLFCVGMMLFFSSKNIYAVIVKESMTDIVYMSYTAVTEPMENIVKRVMGVKNYIAAINENYELKFENNTLKNELQRLQVEANETKRLKELLNYQDTQQTDSVTVRVISSSSDAQSKILNINAGSRSGIKVGQVVVNKDGIIGKIVSVNEHSASIMSIFDTNSKIPVVFLESRTKCVAVGKELNDEFLDTLYLPKENAVIEEEGAITSGEGNIFPYGLKVGTIHKEGDKIYIKAAVKWNAVEFAQVILTKE